MSFQTPIRIVTSGDFSPELQPAIRPITSSRHLFDVYRMHHAYYASRTAGTPRADGLWISHPELDHGSNTTILVAEIADEIIATLSITLDGKQGLPLDKDLPNTAWRIRSEGRRLAQIWRLLLKKGYPSPKRGISALLAEATLRLQSAETQTALYFIEEEYSRDCLELTNAVALTQIRSARELPEAACVLMRSELGRPSAGLSVKKGARHERAPHLNRR